MEFIRFVFESEGPWRFFGILIILIVLSGILKSFFDFIVELIHGKQVVQNINLPEGTKIETTENKKSSPKKKSSKDDEQKVNVEPAISVGEVEVRSNKKNG